MKVLILACHTGTGHIVAAKAIGEELEKNGISWEWMDPTFIDKPSQSENAMTQYHNNFLLKNKTIFAMTFYTGDFMYRYLHLSPVYMLNKDYAVSLKKYIEDNGIDTVIATHMYPLNCLYYIKKKYGLNATINGVLTDYVPHPFFTHFKYGDEKGKGLYFVADTDKIINSFKKYRFPDEAVKKTGIPFASKFNNSISKEEARTKLNLPLDKKIVLLMNSRDGSTHKMCKMVGNGLKENELCIFISNKDEKIESKVKSMFNEDKMRVVSYTEEMEVYLKAVDLIITKAGGLITTESGVSETPICHIGGMPGLENQNAKYFSGIGMSIFSKKKKKIIKEMFDLLRDDERLKAMSLKERELIVKNSAERIVKELINNA